jgi:hypothetical protein
MHHCRTSLAGKLYLPSLFVAGLLCLCSSAYGRSEISAISSATAVADAKPPAVPAPAALSSTAVPIPGPLRSFLRMAGVSQKISPDEVLPLVARNVFTLGYRNGRPTEFLVLLERYVSQAKELTALAGPDGVIRITKCDEAGPLLHILGYRLRQECGQSGASLITSDAERAFLTIDSGFPLPQLEEALQKDGQFTYPFPTSRVPILFSESDWTAAIPENSNSKDPQDLVKALLHESALSRLYFALSRTDPETRVALQQSFGLKKLLPFAPILNFYGNQICIRSGRVIVPGGEAGEAAWKNLVGASPDSPSEFVSRLLARDKGWLTAYFDALSRISQTQQAHFIQGDRLKHFYEAFRPRENADAASHTFRPAPALLILLTRLQWDASGEPYVPGDLDAWKEILHQKTNSKIVHDWGNRSKGWDRPQQLAEAMFAFSRMSTDAGPLQVYLMLSELDRRRSPEKRLSSKTVVQLAEKYSQFSDWYLVFSEFPELSDASITRFLEVAEAVDKIPNHTLRGNSMGIFQANLGLWQVLARQGQIPVNDLDGSWQKIVSPFAKISSSAQLFDAGRTSLSYWLEAATGKPAASQDEIVDLLAGPRQESAEGQRMHLELANGMRSVLDGQRLVSVDTLLALGDGLHEMAKGKKVGDHLLSLAGELRKFEMPRPIFTSSERTQWAAGIYNNHHTDVQMRTDLAKVIKGGGSPAELEEARGQLSTFLRDTLVGLNYAYYEPPGAQILHTNPLFVRSHDFAGETIMGVERLWQSPQLFGEGSPAGGGAHLVGSLADLPYVLAEVEQDFIVPQNVQALIWRELVPGLLNSATLPRWWTVSRNELHAVTLYQRSGEELLTAAAGNEELRTKVMSILSDRMAPQRSAQALQLLRSGRLSEMSPAITPADTFYLAAEFRRRFPGESGPLGSAGQELETLVSQHPSEASAERLSQDFGVPHPILTQSYALELLNVKPFPAFEGQSNRLLAETWDSSNLYWARLADEKGYSPVMLHRLVPELTRRMVEKVFASDFEDWPALLRAMQETGDEFRQGKIVLTPVASLTSGQ